MSIYWYDTILSFKMGRDGCCISMNSHQLINLLYTYGLFLLVCYNKLGIVHCTYIGCVVIISKKMYFCLEIFLTFTNSVDPDKMQHYHLGLYCLHKYSFRGFPKNKGLNQGCCFQSARRNWF